MRTDWSVLVLEIFPLKAFQKSSHQQMNINCMKVQCSRTKMNCKTSLGKYVLKQKFEYRITRSSKTRFLASCKDKSCTFKLLRVRFKRVASGRLLNLLRIIVVSWSCSTIIHGRCQQRLFQSWSLINYWVKVVLFDQWML